MKNDNFELTDDEKEYLTHITSVLLDYENNNLFYVAGINKADGKRNLFLCYNGPDENGEESTFILANILTRDTDMSGFGFSFQQDSDNINAECGVKNEFWDRAKRWWNG